MKRFSGIFIVLIAFTLISIGILPLFKTKDNKESKYNNNIKLNFINHGEMINKSDVADYKSQNIKEFNFRSPEPAEYEISYLANEDSVEFYSNFYNKMYFNSTLKLETGNYYYSGELLNYYKELYSNPFYSKYSIASGKDKINNFDIEYFRIINERKKTSDIYEESFIIVFPIGDSTKLFIKYTVMDKKFNNKIMEELINKVKINKLEKTTNSELNNGYFAGELKYDKHNNNNKITLTYKFKEDGLKEEIYNQSSDYSVLFEDKPNRKEVRAFLIEDDINLTLSNEIGFIKGIANEKFIEDKSTYKDDITKISIKYKDNGIDKESVIMYKKLNDKFTYFVVMKNYEKILNEDLDNYLNINIKK